MLLYPDRKAGSEWVEPKTGMAFVWVPSGCFQMGGDEGSYEQPIHKVCVKGFWMGKYEVTQAQYQQVIGKNPSQFPGASNPVERVSWGDAAAFTEKMSGSTGIKIRLPSESEWEYACRAGHAQERYCGGNDSQNRFAWYRGNSNKRTQPVGELAANDWGLYDMSGSVWEWVQDCWHETYQGAPADGSAWKSPGQCAKRVLRGGSWCNDPHTSARASAMATIPMAANAADFGLPERRNDIDGMGAAGGEQSKCITA